MVDRPKTPSKPPPGKPFLGDDDLFSELDAWDATFDALHGGPEEAQAAAQAAGQAPNALGDSQPDLSAWPGPDLGGRPLVSSPELSDPTALIETLAPDPRGLDRLGSEFDADPDLAERGYQDPGFQEPGYDEDLAIDGGLGPELGVEPADEIPDGGPDGGIDDPYERGAHGRASSATSVETAHLEDPLEADFSDLAQIGGGVHNRSTRQTMPPPHQHEQVADELVIGEDDDDDAASDRTRIRRPSRNSRRSAAPRRGR